MSEHETLAVVRYHTAGRRQPMLIGKDASGRRLPGGPYTIYQVVAVVVVATGMWHTTSLWATQMTAISALLIIGAAAVAAGFLIGRLDFSGRNPLLILLSLLAVTPILISGHPGRISGRTLPANPSRRVRAPVTAHRGPAQQNPRSVADPLLAGPAATPAGRPDLSLVTSPKASVQPPVGAVARLTPLEAFLAAAGKAS